ncbi:MAG: hypothetical protein CMJ19_16470 [Phycisphaeraceae bacterium]|nr:hypothetical protein [Phycisphaeraceae bacterium]
MTKAQSNPKITLPKRPAKRRVTLEQVAIAAGVGRTTVSDILNRNAADKYQPETRKRVEDAVAKLGYTASRAAQQLARGRSGMIGLILTRDLSNPVFANRVEVVEKAIKQLGYRMQLAFTDGDPEMEASCIEQMQADAVEGLIMGPVYESLDLEQHKQILQGHLPVVLFGGTLGSQFDEVGLHPDASIHLAVKHLLSKGHKRVGFLGAPKPRTAEGPSRLFETYLKDAGLKNPGPIIWSPDTDRYDDYYPVSEAFVKQWQAMDKNQRPTAMLCHNDQMAQTTIAACHKAGIRVPEDLSLVGYENAPGSAYLIPALTSIDNRGDQQMRQAIELLMDRIQHPRKTSEKRVIYPELIERDSVLDLR